MMENISSTQDLIHLKVAPQLSKETAQLNVEPNESKPLLFLKYSLIILGVLWGIPWIQSCFNALEAMDIFDSRTQVARTLIVIYSILTISIDGVWIMTSIYKVTFRSVNTNLELRQSYKYQKRLLAFSFLVGLISSVPGVYASYTFNTGLRKYLAIIILFGNVGLATYGFYSLIFEIWDRLKSGSKDSGKQFLDNVRGKYYKLLQYYNKNKEHDSRLVSGEYKDLEEFNELVQTEYSLKLSDTSNKQKIDYIFNLLPIVFGAIISSAQSLIDVILTYNLLTSLSFPIILSYCLSSVMTIPNLFVSFISSREVVTKVVAILRCSPQPRLNHFKHVPCLTFAISILGLLAFFSPLAGCYITYVTLKGSEIDMAIVIGATVTIFAARFCFSNFTIRLLLTEFMAGKMNKKSKREENRVNRMFELVGKVNPKYFKEE